MGRLHCKNEWTKLVQVEPSSKGGILNTIRPVPYLEV